MQVGRCTLVMVRRMWRRGVGMPRPVRQEGVRRRLLRVVGWEARPATEGVLRVRVGAAGDGSVVLSVHRIADGANQPSARWPMLRRSPRAVRTVVRPAAPCRHAAAHRARHARPRRAAGSGRAVLWVPPVTARPTAASATVQTGRSVVAPSVHRRTVPPRVPLIPATAAAAVAPVAPGPLVAAWALPVVPRAVAPLCRLLRVPQVLRRCSARRAAVAARAPSVGPAATVGPARRPAARRVVPPVRRVSWMSGCGGRLLWGGVAAHMCGASYLWIENKIARRNPQINPWRLPDSSSCCGSPRRTAWRRVVAHWPP